MSVLKPALPRVATSLHACELDRTICRCLSTRGENAEATAMSPRPRTREVRGCFHRGWSWPGLPSEKITPEKCQDKRILTARLHMSFAFAT